MRRFVIQSATAIKPICPGNPLDRYSSRREFFYVGLLGGLGLTLPQFLRTQALGATKSYANHAPVAQRGMLDSTLVMVTTEFGRTPKINPAGGRDHWPRVFSTMVAGGGMKRGFVHGASDALGGEVEDGGVTVADFAATIYHQIGINADKELMSPGNRPIEIVQDGVVLDAILANRA